MLDSERFAAVAGTILVELPTQLDDADLEALSAEDTMVDAAAATVTDGARVVIPPPPPFGGWLRGRWARLVPLLRVGR